MKKTKNKRQQTAGVLLLAGGGLVLLVAVLLVLTKQGTGGATIEVSGAPSLQVEQTEINLGDIKLGEYVEASFQLTNVGDQPLRFSRAPYIEIKEGC